MTTIASTRRRSRGMSTIEILAATSICLLILAVASSFFVSQQRMLLVQSASCTPGQVSAPTCPRQVDSTTPLYRLGD